MSREGEDREDEHEQHRGIGDVEKALGNMFKTPSMPDDAKVRSKGE